MGDDPIAPCACGHFHDDPEFPCPVRACGCGWHRVPRDLYRGTVVDYGFPWEVSRG